MCNDKGVLNIFWAVELKCLGLGNTLVRPPAHVCIRRGLR